MFTTILSAIAAIPELLSSIKELIAWFEKAESEKWFADTAAAFAPLEKGPTTPEVKADAAKAIAGAITGL